MARGRKSEYVIDAKVDTTELTGGIAKVTSEFAGLEDKGKEAFEGIQEKAGGFISKLGASEDTVSKFGDIGSKAFGGIDKALGGLPSGFMGMIKGIKGSNMGFKAMKGAIASTGIGLLVIALGELISYLMNSKTFIDIMNNAMLRIKATIKPTVDLILKLGSALGALFSGNPEEAWDIASDAVSGYGDSISDAQKNVTNLIKAQKQLEALLKDVNLRQAEYSRQEYLQIQIAKDRTKSDNERLKALKQVKMFAELGIKAEMRTNKLAVEVLEREAKVKKLSIEQQAELNELKVEDLKLTTELDRAKNDYLEDVKDIEEDAIDREQDAEDDRQDAIDDQRERDADILEAKRELLAELEYLRKSEKAQELFDAKELYDERVAIAGDDPGLLKSALDQYNIDKKAIEDEFQAQADADQQAIDDEKARKTAELDNALKSQQQLEIDRATNQYDVLYALAVEAGYGMEQLKDEQEKRLEDISKKYKKKDIALEGATARSKYEISVKAMEALIGLSRAISEDSEDNAKRRFEVDKAMGIGVATVNTAIAISDALAKDNVAPFSRYASAITAGAIGLAQVVAIKRTTFEGGGSIDDNIDPDGGQDGINEAPQLDLSFLGEGAGQTGVQAYVVSSQMSNSQQAQQQIQDQASLVS